MGTNDQQGGVVDRMRQSGSLAPSEPPSPPPDRPELREWQRAFDVGIVATGSTELRPDIPGPEGLNVVTARAVLEGREFAKGRVVVAGGGCMGTQVAEHLAAQDHPVTMVEALSAAAADAPVDDRALLLGRLAGHDVEIRTDTRLIRRGPRHVVVQSDGEVESLPADTLVLCLGATPVDGIANAIAKKLDRVFVVGDAKEVRKVPDAMAEGALAALDSA